MKQENTQFQHVAKEQHLRQKYISLKIVKESQEQEFLKQQNLMKHVQNQEKQQLNMNLLQIKHIIFWSL